MIIYVLIASPFAAISNKWGQVIDMVLLREQNILYFATDSFMCGWTACFSKCHANRSRESL